MLLASLGVLLPKLFMLPFQVLLQLFLLQILLEKAIVAVLDRDDIFIHPLDVFLLHFSISHLQTIVDYWILLDCFFQPFELIGFYFFVL